MEVTGALEIDRWGKRQIAVGLGVVGGKARDCEYRNGVKLY